MRDTKARGFEILRLALWLVPAVILVWRTALILNQSVIDGRIAMSGIYDDIVYLTAGMRYATALRTGGLSSLAETLVQFPPHGPLTSAAAAVGYLLTSSQLWAPYAMASLLFTTLFYVVTTGWPSLVRVALAAAIAGTYWFELIVASYHPDLLMGTALAGAAFIIATREIERWNWRAILLISFLICTAMFAKPVGFAMIAVLVAAAMVGSGVYALLRGVTLQKVLAKGGQVVALTLIVLAPFLIWRGPALVDYFFMAVINHEHPVGFLPGFDPYLFFDYTFVALRPALPAFIVSAALAACAALATKNGEYGAKLILLALLLALSVIVPAAAPVKQFYFGGVVYALVVFSSAYSAAILYEQVRRWNVLLAATPLLAVTLFWTTTLAPNIVKYPPEEIARSRDWVDAGISAIVENAPVEKIFVAHVTPVAPDALIFEALRRGLPVPEIVDGAFTASIPDLLDLAGDADLVYLQDSASRGGAKVFPVDDLLDPLLAAAKSLPNLEVLRSVPSYMGAYWIFKSVAEN